MASGLIEGRGIQKNTQHFDTTSTADLALLLDPNGNLSSTAAGLRVTINNPTDFRGSLDPAGSGGTATLPTAAGATTTVNNGEAINPGDFYLVTSAGTIGTGITVGGAPAMLVYNGGTITADAGWTLIDGVNSSQLVPQTRTITAGAGLTGGGDLTADRTIDIAAADATITVNADSIQVNPAAFTRTGVAPLDGDTVAIDYTPTGYTPTTAPAQVTDATELTAHLGGIDAALAALPATRNLTAGAGLTGGGDLSADRTFDVVSANAAIVVNADDIAFQQSALVRGGATEVDADVLAITYVPTNYTRVTTPTEVTDATELTAHLAGIDAALAGGVRQEIFTVSAAQAGANALSLVGMPSATASVAMHLDFGGTATHGDGITVSGANNQDISWAGTLAGVIGTGDVLTFTYTA